MSNIGWPHSYAVDFHIAVAKGLIPKHSIIQKFGRNDDMTTQTKEDIWDGGSTYSWISTAGTASIVSSDAKDTSDGVGARTIQIQGLDENWNAQTDNIVLNGTNAVVTDTKWIRINEMEVLSVGSEGDNAGTITATVDSTSAAIITAGFNHCLMAIYTVPNGYTAYFLKGWSSINRKRSTTADMELRVRTDADDSTSPFIVKNVIGLSTTGNSVVFRDFPVPGKFCGKTDIKVSGTVLAGSADVAAGFDILLVQD